MPNFSTVEKYKEQYDKDLAYKKKLFLHKIKWDLLSQTIYLVAITACIIGYLVVRNYPENKVLSIVSIILASFVWGFFLSGVTAIVMSPISTVSLTSVAGLILPPLVYLPTVKYYFKYRTKPDFNFEKAQKDTIINNMAALKVANGLLGSTHLYGTGDAVHIPVGMVKLIPYLSESDQSKLFRIYTNLAVLTALDNNKDELDKEKVYWAKAFVDAHVAFKIENDLKTQEVNEDLKTEYLLVKQIQG